MFIKEKVIIGGIWLLTFISFWFIPKQRYREAYFIFMFAQLPSWFFGLLVVEAGLIKYPVRELAKANATSFSFEFLVLPFICIFFNLHFPESKSFNNKALYYVSILGTFTLVEYFAERYTLILKYIHWSWYTTFVTMTLLIYMVRLVYKWYFHIGKPFSPL